MRNSIQQELPFGWAASPEDDEILYSWVARLVGHHGIKPPLRVIRLLFGGRATSPSIDLPTRLDFLKAALGSICPHADVEQLASCMTLWPYHSAFLSNERRATALGIMTHGRGSGLKTLLGRVANGFGASDLLRYCHLCIERDWQLAREPYWRRRHQLPGVACCAEHAVTLVCVPMRNAGSNPFDLILPPSFPLCKAGTTADATNLQVARLSDELLVGVIANRELSSTAALYWRKLQELGYADRLKRVRWNRLCTDLSSHFNRFATLHNRSRLSKLSDGTFSWVRALFQKPQRSSHPLCHILLTGF